MKTFPIRGHSEIVDSDRDDLKHLYREVQRLRMLVGVLRCGSPAGPLSLREADEFNHGRSIH